MRSVTQISLMMWASQGALLLPLLPPWDVGLPLSLGIPLVEEALLLATDGAFPTGSTSDSVSE